MDEEQTVFQTVGEQQSAAELSHEEEPELPGYKLERLVGAGSFGQVWAGVHERTGRKVAVKLLVSSLTSEALKVELDRLRVATDHPHVVDLLDADTEHEPPFLSMPWLSGGNLSEQPRPAVLQAEQWIQQVAEALKSIHAKGILHCDLKPANVLLDDEERAYLADFGQSLVLGGRSRAWGTIGTMPPEQALLGTEEKFSSPNVSWDIYALGATSYYLLTGRLPRLLAEDLKSMSAGSSVEEKLDQYREFLSARPLCPVRQLNPEVDSELAYLIEACLHLEPDKRPATVDEILQDLERRKDRQPLLCRRPWTVTYQISCWMRRPLVAVSVLFLLLAVGGLAYGNARLNQANDELSQANTELTTTMGQLMEGRGDSLMGNEKTALLWYAEALQALPEDTFLRRKVAKPVLSLSDIKADFELGFFQGSELCLAKEGAFQRGSETFTLDGRLGLVSSDGRFGLAEKQGDALSLIAFDLAGTPKPLFHLPMALRHIKHLSPEGRFLTAPNNDLELLVYDRQGRQVANLGRRSTSLGFLDDVTLAYSPDGSSVMLWRPDEIRKLATLDMTPENVALVGSGQVAVVTNTETRLLSLSDGRELSRCSHALSVEQISENLLLLASVDRLEVRFIPGLHLVATLPQDAFPSQVVLSPDKSRFAVLNDRGVRLYQADPPQALTPELPTFGDAPVHKGYRIEGLRFAPDGRRFVTYSGETRVWDVAQTPALYQFEQTELVGWLDGKLVAGALAGPLQTLEDGRVLPHEGRILNEFADGEVWETSDGRLQRIISSRLSVSKYPGVLAAANDLLARRTNESVEVVRLPSGEKVLSFPAKPLEGPESETADLMTDSPDGLALAPAGNLLAYSDKAGIKLIEIPSGRTLRTFPEEGVTALDFDRTGKLLVCRVFSHTGAEKDQISVINVADGSLVHQFEECTKAHFAPSDDLLIVKGTDDISTVYSSLDWSPRFSFPGQGWFLPDTGLLIRYQESEIQVMEAGTGRMLDESYRLKTGQISYQYVSMAFDPVGYRLAVADNRKRVSVLQIPKPVENPPKEVERMVQKWTGLRLDVRSGKQLRLTSAEWGEL